MKTMYEPPPAVPATGPASPSVQQREASAKYPPIDPKELNLPQSPSVQPQDLSQDPLLTTLIRVQMGSHRVPQIAGIPLLARIGRGGMGAVYYGLHLRLGIEVAVKILPFHLAEQNPDTIQRFSQEAQFSARIQSDHLVRVLDINEENGLFFLVMEFVYGESAGVYLKRLKREGKKGLPEQEAIKLSIAACKGLAAAHKAGVVHRDIKPDNILIPQRADGSYEFERAKLADLGLSRTENEDKGLTVTQVAMGTPGFMAPEQADDAKRVTKSADIYSMGACIYDLISGHPPFHGKQMVQVILDTQQKPHEPLRSIAPEISVALNSVVDNCLEKHAHNRLSDGGALGDALSQCLVRPFEVPEVVSRLRYAQTKQFEETIRPSVEMITNLGISGVPTPKPPDAKPIMAQQEPAAPPPPPEPKADKTAIVKDEDDTVNYAPAHITSERPKPKEEREKTPFVSLFLTVILLGGGGLVAYKFVIDKPEKRSESVTKLEDPKPEPKPSNTSTSTGLNPPKPDVPETTTPVPGEIVSDSSDANYNAELRDGNKALNEKRWKDSVDAFRRALVIDSKAKAAREGIKAAHYGEQMEKGAAALKAKDWTQALKNFQAALESKPNDPEALNGIEKAKAQKE
jgi:serine/threonine protein kinase